MATKKSLPPIHPGVPQVNPLPSTKLESPDAPTIYQGKPLSLEEIEEAVIAEAGKHMAELVRRRLAQKSQAVEVDIDTV